MNSVPYINNKFLLLFNNIRSENLGFYFSFVIHLLILLFVVGIPDFFGKKKIYVPDIIPIEIINVTDVTSIPEKIEEKDIKIRQDVSKKVVETKKFNSAQNQEIKKVELKTKPEIKENESKNLKTPKDDILLKEKLKDPIKLEKEKKTPPKLNEESLPTKKIKPKIKPKPTKEKLIDDNSDVIIKANPKPKPKEKFTVDSLLKDLRNEKSIQNKKEDEIKEKIDNDIKKDEVKNENKNVQLSISEIDLLRQQLSSCWIAPAGAVIEKGMLVKISAKLQQNRKIYSDSVRIIDTNISKSNPFYGPITESAMRTLLNPDCIPLKLPEKKYNLWKNLTITFDYSIMKGY